MKSLEVVNKLLEKINQYDDWFLTEVEAEQIKQDLEVLEIFIEKRLDLWFFKYLLINANHNVYEALENYNKCIGNGFELTIEEANKLKQWLEENEE